MCLCDLEQITSLTLSFLIQIRNNTTFQVSITLETEHGQYLAPIDLPIYVSKSLLSSTYLVEGYNTIQHIQNPIFKLASNSALLYLFNGTTINLETCRFYSILSLIPASNLPPSSDSASKIYPEAAFSLYQM